MKKNGKPQKNTSAKSKKNKSKLKGGEKKGENQKGKMGKQWTCPFAFFCTVFILLSRFVFFACIYFAFCLEKTHAKEKQKKQIEKAK